MCDDERDDFFFLSQGSIEDNCSRAKKRNEYAFVQISQYRRRRSRLKVKVAFFVPTFLLRWKCYVQHVLYVGYRREEHLPVEVSSFKIFPSCKAKGKERESDSKRRRRHTYGRERKTRVYTLLDDLLRNRYYQPTDQEPIGMRSPARTHSFRTLARS